MKATIPIGLQPGTRALRMERVAGDYNKVPTSLDCDPGHWRIWLHHDRQLTQGTILRLYDDGSADQVTLDEDGIESNYIKIKGPDK
jgi:hypothetical protein